MRFIELETNTNEGRQWTADDDAKQLARQMSVQDNIHALNVYFQDVHITNTVKVLASRPDCKWFFDLMSIKLHELNADGVNAVDFCMHRFEDEWQVWARDEHDLPHVFNNECNGHFPFAAISLRAVHDGKFWCVSLIDVSNRVIT